MAGNTIIQIKRSTGTNTPGSLAAGELAYSYSSNNLFIGASDGTPLNIGGVSTLVKLQAAYDAANAAVGGTAADGWAREQANASFAHANSAYDEANSAYSYAGTVETYAQAAYGQANTTTTYAETGFAHANAAYDQANTATTDAATAQSTADAAYGQANTGTTIAQAAYDAANNVVSSFDLAGDSGTDTFSTGETLTFTGGVGITTSVSDNQVTIEVDNTVIRSSSNTGPQTIEGGLTITGDLIITGNTVTQDVQTIVSEDSLIQLAANNTTDALDIGFFGQYSNGGGGYYYTSLMRDASDGKYKLLTSGTEKPAAGNTVNISAFSTATLVADIEADTVSTGTLTATSLPYDVTLSSTQGFMVVNASTGAVSYTFNVDGGSF